MSQISCKRLLILLINLCILGMHSNAQDSTAASPAQEKITAPGKVNAPPTKTVESSQVQPAPTPVRKIAPVKISDNSIKGQYDELLKHSWMQQGYKVVNANRLTTLWNTVNDSLAIGKKQLNEAKLKLAEQTKLLADLKTGTSPSTKSSAPVKEISFLGMPVKTSTYNWIVWGLITVLAVALVGVLFTTTKNSMDAKNHKQLYDEITAEYHTYKAKSKEKELKLSRELQTERNTIEELLAQKSERNKKK